MTYCVGMLLRSGLLMVSDSRTNAGVDYISTFRKMHVWEVSDERAIVLLTAGNLAISQAVVAMLNEGVPGDETDDEALTMVNVSSMTAAARLTGRAVREVERLDGESLKAHRTGFDVSMILGGQIRGRQLRLFQIYAAGNFIEATPETPFFQIGETKYGKPIIDRVVDFETKLGAAAKCALISMESTMRSNISVGPPIDVLVCERDKHKVATHVVIDEGDAYFEEIRLAWASGLRDVFAAIPDPVWQPRKRARRSKATR